MGNFSLESELRVLGKKSIQYSKQYIVNLPIPKVSSQAQKPFIKLADKVLSSKDSNPSFDTTPLEAEIDGRVAHLYNLTEEEYALILKGTNCPDPFRVAALNIYRDIAKEKTKD